MKHHLRFTSILLVTMMTICVTEGTFVQKLYKKLEPGEDIVGVVIAVKKAVSPIECSRMCLSNNRCTVYQYKGTGPENCLLIHKNCSHVDGQIFEDNANGETYHKVVKYGWSGSEAALYLHFDLPDGLILMESSEPMGPIPLVSRLINCSLTLNHTRRQWVDLGIHTDACMTQPDECGVAGGAISLWVNIVDVRVGGIISSYLLGKTGVRIYCTSQQIRVGIYLSVTQFTVFRTRPTGWTHVVLNYIGPNAGIKVFFNGAEVGSDTHIYTSSSPNQAGEGRIVVGRFYPDKDTRYTSMQIDELIFFNKALSTTDIKLLYYAV